MPKVVDHEERRRDVADALLRLVGREGPRAVSLRAVAAEAGWSTGALAHYFADKEALLAFAFAAAHERADARARRAAARARCPRGAVRAHLVEALPLDARRRSEARAWIGFLELTTVDPDSRSVVVRRYEDWTRMLADGLVRAGVRPASASGVARELLALVDGLTVQALAAPGMLPRATQERILDAALGRLLGPASS